MAVGAVAACGGSSGGQKPIEGPVSEGSAAGEVAKRLCRQWRQCDCGDLAGVSLDGCEAGMRFAFQARLEDAKDEGLSFDGDCLARKLNAMVERGCAPFDPATAAPGCNDEPCQIFHGSVAEGGECDGRFGTSECAQGLVCFDTCQEPCAQGGATNLGEGEVCVDASGSRGQCAPPLTCDPDSGRCRALPADGEPCLQSQCAEGHYCDPRPAEPTCRTHVPVGQACTLATECASLSCEGSTCQPLPGTGEPCVVGCEGDLVCAPDETGMRRCASLPGSGEPCLQGVITACAEGLGCVDGTCRNAPGEDEPCLTPTGGSTVRCAEGLVCGGKLCSTAPRTPGCDECAEPLDRCVVQVCIVEPPAVCADSGGLLL